MTLIRYSDMNHNPNKFIFKIRLRVLVLLLLIALLFLLSESLLSEILKVNSHRKLTHVIEFLLLHSVVVELKAFQHKYEVVWQFFEAHSADSGDFFIAFFTLVGVVAIQNLTLNHALKTLFNVLHIFNL